MKYAKKFKKFNNKRKAIRNERIFVRNDKIILLTIISNNKAILRIKLNIAEAALNNIQNHNEITPNE